MLNNMSYASADTFTLFYVFWIIRDGGGDGGSSSSSSSSSSNSSSSNLVTL